MSCRIPPRRRAPLALAIALWLAAPAGAAVPGQVDFQGLLLDAAGDPVTGAVDLAFTLYDAASAGSAVWSESHPAVQVVDGVYDVVLGATSPLTPGLLSAGPLYLEIEVAGETLAPRRQLLAVPYAIRADSAQSADALSGDGGIFLQQIVTHFAFDGSDPPNEDPREGFGDTDGDGLANFVDPDNDDDGLSDGAELAQGSDINLVTPAISGFSPPSAPAGETTVVSLQGTNFEPGMTVAFGSENPMPSNVTPTSLDVQVGPQVVGSAPVTLTRTSNGEQASASFDFDQTLAITGFSPPSAPAADTTVVTLQGTGFEPAMTIAFGSESPALANVTPTSLDVQVGPQSVGTAPVTLTRTSNAEQASASFDFEQTLSITGFDPVFLQIDGGSVTVQGTGFETDMTVQFGLQTPTPTNVTPTSFDVVLAPQEPAVLSVTVTRNSNGETANSSYQIRGDTNVFFVAGAGTGDLGGLAGADAICAAAAAAQSLPGTYLAWLADASASPATRFDQSAGPYVRLDGTVIADDWADLTDGSLDLAITTSGSLAWTNVATDGTAKGGNHCSNWTSTSGGSVPVGFPTASDATWTDAATHICSAGAGLYCFRQ